MLTYADVCSAGEKEELIARMQTYADIILLTHAARARRRSTDTMLTCADVFSGVC